MYTHTYISEILFLVRGTLLIVMNYFAHIKFILHNNFRRYTINTCKPALFLVIGRNPLLTKVLTDFIYNT